MNEEQFSPDQLLLIQRAMWAQNLVVRVMVAHKIKPALHEFHQGPCPMPCEHPCVGHFIFPEFHCIVPLEEIEEVIQDGDLWPLEEKMIRFKLVMSRN